MRRRSLAAVGTLSHDLIAPPPPSAPSQCPCQSTDPPCPPFDVNKERTHRFQIWQYIKNACAAEEICNCRSPASRCQMTVWHEVKYDEKVRRKEKKRKKYLGSRPARNINSACKSRIDRSNMYANGESSQNALPKPSFPVSQLNFLRYLCNLEHTTAPAPVAS